MTFPVFVDLEGSFCFDVGAVKRMLCRWNEGIGLITDIAPPALMDILSVTRCLSDTDCRGLFHRAHLPVHPAIGL